MSTKKHKVPMSPPLRVPGVPRYPVEGPIGPLVNKVKRKFPLSPK